MAEVARWGLVPQDDGSDRMMAGAGGDYVAFADYSTLLIERDELREALRPFASRAAEYNSDCPDYIPAWHEGDELEPSLVTVGDFRRAARLLAGKGVKG